jgi:hypothetical protein
MLKQAFLPGLIATSLISTLILPMHSAEARPRWVRDIAVGAGTSAATGAVMRNGSVLGNTLQGAAAGAAVSATQRAGGNSSAVSVLRDASVGAATGIVTGEITGNGSVGANAVKGAAAGTLVNVTAR